MSRDLPTGYVATLAVSLVVAALAVSLVTFSRQNSDNIAMGLLLSGFWLLLVAGAAAIYRWRAAWLLIGAPAALFYPVYVELFFKVL